MFCSRPALQKEFFSVRMRERWSKLQANWDLYQPSGTELFWADEELNSPSQGAPLRCGMPLTEVGGTLCALGAQEGHAP
jgi:hypothetical protein